MTPASRYLKVLSLVAALLLSAVGLAHAAPILWVHDSSGVLGKVDIATGNVTIVGNMGAVMTDIAFDPSGALYGVTFSNLYSINKATAAATLIGGTGQSSLNALVFGTDGTLYSAASGNSFLFRLNPATGAATSLGNMGFNSGGDLAFFGGELYLADGLSRLVRVDIDTPPDSDLIGSFGFGSVFGLAAADNGVLYGVGGTQIFSVNQTTGAGTLVVNYSGKGLGGAFGQSFITEAGAPDPEDPTPGPGPGPGTGIPAPAAAILLGVGLATIHLLRRR